MHWGGPFFVLTIIGMSFGAWIVTTWIRARHGYPIENEWGGMSGKGDLDTGRKIALLASENGDLMAKIDRLEERVRVLERIVTDRSADLTHEIERLRAPADAPRLTEHRA